MAKSRKQPESADYWWGRYEALCAVDEWCKKRRDQHFDEAWDYAWLKEYGAAALRHAKGKGVAEVIFQFEKMKTGAFDLWMDAGRREDAPA